MTDLSAIRSRLSALRHWWLPALLFALVAGELFSPLIFGRGDAFYYFMPYWEYRRQALLSGTIPLWNPTLFLGTPFLANPQSAVLYPLNWLVLPFATPTAFKISVGLHLLIALQGAYQLARRQALSRQSATLSASLFALGGYLSAKAEQINQLQGLAWLPWILFAIEIWLISPQRTQRWRAAWGLAMLLSIQFLAGHTQTTFICWVGAGIWLAARGVANSFENAQTWGWKLGSLFGKQNRNALWCTLQSAIQHSGRWLQTHWASALLLGGIFCLLVTAQLLPTLELSRQSLRSGGLSVREAIAFSWHPLLVGYASLPNYARAFFTEYNFNIGVSGVALLALMLTAGARQTRHWQALALLLGGLFLALGGYNPFYWILAKYVPGFDLFRVPARWLALAALGGGLTAGMALENWQAWLSRRWGRWVMLGAPVLFMGWAFAAARTTPPGELGALGRPENITLLGWGLAWGALALASAFPARQWSKPLLLATLCLELGLASWQLPLHGLTSPQVWQGVRPALAQVLLGSQQSPGRVLSLSALQFDPGDLPALESEWSFLSKQGQFDAMVATKNNEVLGPNLPMAWGIASVDGYDGGLLPTRAYAQFVGESLGIAHLNDGRLREFLSAIPSPQWLATTNTRWLITDKVGDIWLDGVYYDTQFAPHLAVLQNRFGLQGFSANGALVLLEKSSGQWQGNLQVWQGNRLLAESPLNGSEQRADGVVALSWDKPLPKETALTVQITLDGSAPRLLALTAYDWRTETFLPLTPLGVRLAHNGDVKVYELLESQPAQLKVSVEDPPAPALLQVESYQNTGNRLRLRVNAQQAGWLQLAEAADPNWQAWVDGRAQPLMQLEGFFRALPLKAGTHDIEMLYLPGSWRLGWKLGLLGLGGWLGWGLALLRRKPSAEKRL